MTLGDQMLSPGLAGRPIVDPEQDQAHLIEPQDLRQVRSKVVGDAQVASLERFREVLHIALADLAGFGAEGRERMLRVGGVAKKRAEEFAIGAEIVELHVDDGAQASLK